MHQSSLNNMSLMLSKVLTPDIITRPFTVVDYGGRRIDGHESYYSLLKNYANLTYLGLDIQDGPGVDIVMTDPYKSPIKDNTVDIVVTGQMFEHCEFFWLTFEDIARILKPGGYLLAITPSAGPVHKYPVDCWRFYPDAYAAMAKWSKMTLIEAWHDLSGKWCDQVGILKKP